MRRWSRQLVQYRCKSNAALKNDYCTKISVFMIGWYDVLSIIDTVRPRYRSPSHNTVALDQCGQWLVRWCGVMMVGMMWLMIVGTCDGGWHDDVNDGLARVVNDGLVRWCNVCWENVRLVMGWYGVSGWLFGCSVIMMDWCGGINDWLARCEEWWSIGWLLYCDGWYRE